MTDKVQKIREKVVEMVNSINPFIPDEDGKNSDYEAGKLDAATQILQIIDFLEEPVSEELEEEIRKEIKNWFNEDETPRITILGFVHIARHFAEWQKKKDFQDMLMSDNRNFEKCYEQGKADMREQIMEDAKTLEVAVHIDAGGYPYIPQIELYDYDKDIPLAKEGDKYNVVLIKEE